MIMLKKVIELLGLYLYRSILNIKGIIKFLRLKVIKIII